MRDYSFEITKKQHDYLLPIFGKSGCYKKNRLYQKIDNSRGDRFFFIGTNEEHEDMLERCAYLD